MKIKKLDDWNPKELLICSAILISLGFALGNFLMTKGVIIQILFILIIFTGVIFFAVGVGKMVKKRGQTEKNFSEEVAEPKNVKESIIAFVIWLLITPLSAYWFQVRPQQITLKCFREATSIQIDFFSTSSDKDVFEKKFHECLKRSHLEK